LLDIGSTPPDIIPIVDGDVAARGRSDTERLLNGELVYSGVGRTPICAVIDRLPWRGTSCPVAAEMFATTADAHLVLGHIEEDAHADWTADGRPLTVSCARQRLARQVCADAADVAEDDFEQFARAVHESQMQRLENALYAVIDALPGMPNVFIVSGSGEFLARAVLQKLLPGRKVIGLSAMIGLQVSQCAPAHAVAVLAAEQG